MAKTKTQRWTMRGVYSEDELMRRARKLFREGDSILADSIVALVNRLHCNDCNVLIELPTERHTNAIAFDHAAVMHELGCPGNV